MKTIENYSKEPEGTELQNTSNKSSGNYKSPQNSNITTSFSNGYMTLIKRNYVYECASDIYCSTLGKARQDVVNNPVAKVWGREIFYEIIKKCLDKCFAGETVKYEGWIEFPLQGRRYLIITHHPYFDEQGKVTHAGVALRDITEQKIEEEALRKSESNFRSVLKNMHFGVFSFNTEGKFTFVNDVVVERTGYSREWFAQKSLFDFVRPEDRDRAMKGFENTVRGVSVQPYDFAYYKASGEISWLQVNTTPTWEKGQIVGVLSVLLDITKRKKSEHALSESEEKYRRLFEDSSDAIFITDRKGILTDVNMSFLNLFGYSKEEVIGLDTVYMHENHDEKNICGRAMNEKGFLKDYELKLKKKDGAVMYCLFNGTVRRSSNGTIIGYQGIVRDESARKQLEEALQDSELKLRSIIYGSPIPQFVIDKNHRVTHWNRALEMVTGIKTEEVEGTNQHWKAFYSIERPCIADLIVDENYQKISSLYNEKNIKSDISDGAYRIMDFFQELGNEGKWLHITSAAIRDSRGNILGAVETIEDATEQKLAEDTIQKTEERCLSILEGLSPSYHSN